MNEAASAEIDGATLVFIVVLGLIARPAESRRSEREGMLQCPVEW